MPDLLPAFVLIGIGMGVSFVAVTIAGLQGVPGRDAGIASGLVNTSRQVGGAVGLAVVSTVAAASAGRVAGAEALTHGFRISFAVLAGLAVAAALLTGLALPRSCPRSRKRRSRRRQGGLRSSGPPWRCVASSPLASASPS